MSKKYKVNYNRIRVFIIAFLNVLTIMITIRNAFVDQIFIPSFSTQFDYSNILEVYIVLLALVITIWLNVRFVKRIKHSRLLIGLIQMLLLIYVMRNLYIGFMYFGLMVDNYLKYVLGFIILSSLIYQTMFSKHINSYYEKIE